MKTMLVTFFDCRGLIHKEFVSTGEIVNVNFYKDVLDHLIKRIDRARPDLCASGDCFLQHDNALAHNAASIHQFLPQKILQSFITLHIRGIWRRPIIYYSRN